MKLRLPHCFSYSAVIHYTILSISLLITICHPIPEMFIWDFIHQPSCPAFHRRFYIHQCAFLCCKNIVSFSLFYSFPQQIGIE